MAVPVKTGLPPLPMMKYPDATGEMEVVLKRDLPKLGEFRWTARMKGLFKAALDNSLLSKAEFENNYHQTVDFLSDAVAPKEIPTPPTSKEEPKVEPVFVLPWAGVLEVGVLKMDLDTLCFTINGVSQDFESPRQRFMLTLFMAKRGECVSRKEILTLLIQKKVVPQGVHPNSVETYVFNLKRLLGACRNYIQSVPGGYIFGVPATAQ